MVVLVRICSMPLHEKMVDLQREMIKRSVIDKGPWFIVLGSQEF